MGILWTIWSACMIVVGIFGIIYMNSDLLMIISGYGFIAAVIEVIKYHQKYKSQIKQTPGEE